MTTYCLRGHLRTPDNVYPAGNCKICACERTRNWQKENPERKRENERRWREKNPERERAIHLAKTCDLDVDTIHQYLLERNNVFVCDICQQECSSGKRLAVDHDHETNEIRGLLCGNCNTGLGKFKDSVKLMEIATEYLKNKGAK